MSADGITSGRLAGKTYMELGLLIVAGDLRLAAKKAQEFADMIREAADECDRESAAAKAQMS